MFQLLSGLDDFSGIKGVWGHNLTLDPGPKLSPSPASGLRQSLALFTTEGSYSLKDRE